VLDFATSAPCLVYVMRILTSVCHNFDTLFKLDFENTSCFSNVLTRIFVAF
jgi:hypothetical protein